MYVGKKRITKLCTDYLDLLKHIDESINKITTRDQKVYTAYNLFNSTHIDKYFCNDQRQMFNSPLRERMISDFHNSDPLKYWKVHFSREMFHLLRFKGKSLKNIKNYPEARSSFQEAKIYLKIYSQFPGCTFNFEEEENILIHEIASCWCYEDNNTEALRLTKIACKYYLSNHSPNIPKLCYCYDTIANCYFKMGNVEESLIYCVEELRLRIQYSDKNDQVHKKNISDTIKHFHRCVIFLQICEKHNFDYTKRFTCIDTFYAWAKKMFEATGISQRKMFEGQGSDEEYN